MASASGSRPGELPFISTGRLPGRSRVAQLLAEAHDSYRGVTQGYPSQVYPALASADPGLFGVCLVDVDGTTHAVGDADHPFTIMSVAKPFVFAAVCEALGPQDARRRIGANATGLPFNSVAAVERSNTGHTNPMVNPGAIVTTSLVPGAGEEKWTRIHEVLSAFAGRELALDEGTYASATTSNHVNRAAANLLYSRGLLGCDVDLALDLYTRQSCLEVTARDLATMAATLADGGKNPVTGDRVVEPELCHAVLAVMVTAGMYEESGDWLFDVGQPAKSGIGGGILTVSPGKGGLGTFSPPLDGAGNSVRGGLVARFLAHHLGLDLLASAPL